MIQTIAAREITLEELREKFNLQEVNKPGFFREWQENLPSLTEEEKKALARVKSNYFNLVSSRPMLEQGVKMVVLSPLLDLAGFYQSPFSIKTEAYIEIEAEDEGIIVRGNIDVLVVKQSLWILVIESKSTKFDVMVALPQALIYLLNSPNINQPCFGFITNGREFVFIKLTKTELYQYSRSYSLSLERENELQQVLAVLKKIGQVLLNS